MKEIGARLSEEHADIRGVLKRHDLRLVFLTRQVAIHCATRLHRIYSRMVVQRIQAVAENPRFQDSEKLAGYTDRYRIRQGRYRIIYLIDDERREVTISGSDIGEMSTDKLSGRRENNQPTPTAAR